MHLRTSRPHHLELAISQCRLGIPNENVTKPRLESFQDTCFNVFQIVPQHFCQKWDLLNHNYSTDSTSINHNFPHQHPLIQAEPPQRHNSNEKPSPLWRSLSPPEELPNSGRSRGCPDALGPADLLAPSGPCDKGPPPGAGLWMDDSRVVLKAVARWGLVLWSATGERQCVVGDAVWHIDSSNTKTCKSDLHRMGWWEPRSQGEGFSCTAWSWHTLPMHQPKL